jgi:S-DNA-T family DNA segregation ATPase FtsK/SpoIIIE
MAERRKKVEEEPEQESPPWTEPDAPAKEGALVKIKKIVQDNRYRRSAGLVVMMLCLVSLTSMISYLFTWRADQDKVISSWSALFGNQELMVENWMGKTGAVLAHLLIYNGFGIATAIIPFLLFFWGLRTTFAHLSIPIKKAWRGGLFLMAWTSILLAYFFREDLLFLGGTFGYEANLWFKGWFGMVGTPLVLAVMLGVFLLFNFKKRVPAPVAAGDETDQHPAITEDPTLVSEPANKEEKAKGRKKFRDWNEPLPEPEKTSILKQTVEESPLIIENKEAEQTEPAEALAENTPATFTLKSKNDDLDLIVETAPAESPALPVIADDEDALPHAEGDYDPKLDLAGYQHPPTELLEKRGSDTITINNEELQQNKERIVETLKNYNIEIDKIKATIGPSVTLYEIVPAPGVRISKIKNLEDDIALSISALGIRIIAPIPGKGTIGIEVPNQKAEVVSMRSVIESEKFQNTPFDLPIALGKTISNETFIADLAKMPHLLMAGATGQGKSVGLNAILVSLLYRKHPSQIKFVLVDPKKVELTLFNTIERHFLAKLPNSEEAIITDTKKVIHTLNSLCILMDTRYELLKNAQVRNLKEYNAKFISRRLNPLEGHHFMPYIVVVIDEFADLIMTAGKEVEMPIARLAQLARAIGIHLIIATQRPSVNIITGTIKANFPARIAFRVSAKIDSRTILDAGGAEQLIGRGDMLLSTGNDLIRIQCAFVDTPEVEKITEFIGAQRAYPNAYLLPEFHGEDEDGEREEFDPAERDAFFNDAARIIVQHQQGSTSLIQRKLKLGYNRAGRIIDQLEAAGVVGPFEGSKARQVLIPDEASLEQFLNSL